MQKTVKEGMYRFLTSNFIPGLFFCLFLAGSCGAQSKLLVLALDASEQTVFWANIKGFSPKPLETDGFTLVFKLDSLASPDSFYLRLLTHFRQKSFLLVSLDAPREPGLNQFPDANDSLDTGKQSQYRHLKLRIGPEIQWLSLRAGAGFGSNRWLKASGFRSAKFHHKPLRADELIKLQRSVLEQAENNGYPFASVWLDSVNLQENGAVSALLQVDPKRFFTFKTLRISGDVKLPKAFLLNYLGIRPGTPYSRTRVLRLRDQLRSLAFLELVSNPSVSFAGNPDAESGEAILNLVLRKKRASRFDFLIGLLPQPDAADRKLLLTGSLSAAFQNAMGLGEHFSAELERLRPETQKIDVQAGVPYLLGSAFGVEGRLGIFKRDSSWTDAQGEAGISYLFSGADYVRFFWENKTSSLQKVDTLAVLLNRQLPQNLDFKQNGFGLETSFSRLDYRFNPRKGWIFLLKAVAGFNTVKRNTQIENLRDPGEPGFRFSSLYDSIAGRAARYRIELSGAVYLPVFQRSAIKLGWNGGGIFSAKTVFANENYRIGGNKRLRGFDEESLFATRFMVATAEWRLLTGPNSFLSAFADWGYLENLAGKNRIFLRPLGLGAGLNFETKAGIFGISAAVGRRDTGQAVDFRATKFHLGYVSLF